MPQLLSSPCHLIHTQIQVVEVKPIEELPIISLYDSYLPVQTLEPVPLEHVPQLNEFGKFLPLILHELIREVVCLQYLVQQAFRHLQKFLQAN